MAKILGALFSRCSSIGNKLTSSLSSLFAAGGSEDPQFMILGLDGAGKTMLMYRLKIPNWKKDEMKECLSNIKKPRQPKAGEDKVDEDNDPCDWGYHYEEISKPFDMGLWDMPGTIAMRHIWPSIYQSIKVHGVIFVVNCEDAWDPNFDDKNASLSAEQLKEQRAANDRAQERVALSRKYLHMLMNEDDLRQSAFCVVVNQRVSRDPKEKDDRGNAKPMYDAVNEDRLEYMLGLHDLHPSCAWRTKKFVINIMNINGESDPKWVAMLEWARGVISDPQGLGMKIG